MRLCFPLRGDWLADFFPATCGQYATSCPRAVLAQQVSGNVEAYLQPEAPEHFILHTVRAPTWLVGRRFSDPLRDLDRLGLVERAALPVERGFQDRSWRRA